DGDPRVVLPIEGLIHPPHAAPSYLTEDVVTLVYRLPDEGVVPVVEARDLAARRQGLPAGLPVVFPFHPFHLYPLLVLGRRVIDCLLVRLDRAPRSLRPRPLHRVRPELAADDTLVRGEVDHLRPPVVADYDLVLPFLQVDVVERGLPYPSPRPPSARWRKDI